MYSSVHFFIMAIEAVGLGTWTFRDDLPPPWWSFPLLIIQWLPFFFLGNALCSEISLIWHYLAAPALFWFMWVRYHLLSRFNFQLMRNFGFKTDFCISHTQPSAAATLPYRKAPACLRAPSLLGFFILSPTGSLSTLFCCGSLLMTICVACSPSHLRWGTSALDYQECKQAEVSSFLKNGYCFLDVVHPGFLVTLAL